MTSANVTVLTVLCLHGMLAFVASQLSEEDKEEILNTHNRLRRDFAKGANGVIVTNMRKLGWNSHLELVAQQTLNLQCSRTLNTFVRYNRGYLLNEKKDSSGNFTGDIVSWYSNITRQFVPSHHVCYPYQDCVAAYTVNFTPLGQWVDGEQWVRKTSNSHFNIVQMLNAYNHNIGCAHRRNCGDDNVLLCLYDAESNVPFIKEGPAVCTHCEGSTPFCDDGLCVACDSEQGQCDCRKTCYGHQVGQGTLTNETCTCECQYGLGPNCDEECKNRQIYEDYDICAEITEDMCDFPEFNDMLEEFCPAVCHCKKFPTDRAGVREE